MQDKKKEVLIIIPAYNEGKTIGALLDKLEAPEIANLADILVMNDASKDNTAQIVKEHGHTVVNHIYNLGYGSGLQVGYKYAVRKGYKYVIQMDADGQHDVSNVKRIYDALHTKNEKGAYPDIVLGARFMKGGYDYPTTPMKKIAYVIFRFLIRLGTGKKIADPTTGLQGLSQRAFTYYAQYNHFDDMYPDANMIMQMLLLGYHVEEIPALMHVRTEGISMHSGFKPVIYMFRMMYSIIAVWLRIKLFRVDVETVREGNVS